MDVVEMNPWRRSRPLAVAHRGQSASVPDNTLESFARAIELGAEMIEGDVQMSRDGHLAMMHDATIERTTNGTGRVADLRWDELQRLDASGQFGAEFPGLRIPSLDAVLELADSKRVPVCVDVKAGSTVEAIATATAVADLIRRRAAADRVVLNSFHYDAFAAAKRVLPELQVVPDISSEVSDDPPATVRLARSLAALITMNHADLPTETVALLHDAGVAVWVWGVTGEASVARSVEQGVDGILGQDISTIVKVLDRLCPAR